MKTMSLRKFRTEIVNLHEIVDVARRDAEGNLQVLGYWTPYAQWSDDATVLAAPLELLTAERWEEAQKHQSPMRVRLEDISLEPGTLPIDPKTFAPPRASFGTPHAVPKPARKKR